MTYVLVYLPTLVSLTSSCYFPHGVHLGPDVFSILDSPSSWCSCTHWVHLGSGVSPHTRFTQVQVYLHTLSSWCMFLQWTNTFPGVSSHTLGLLKPWSIFRRLVHLILDVFSHIMFTNVLMYLPTRVSNRSCYIFPHWVHLGHGVPENAGFT